ncbi:hypothetical protein VN24_13510 [Paenibacillus beijingensis]|uniref:Uncharacterized protein n=1 Tax=Paenibacillus beijingensis TaxID=1126833 RepID=A0A0D5NJ46_9BACL|nr:hypothetical protein VN24_13510 [Paenibacillus beijingensis]
MFENFFLLPESLGEWRKDTGETYTFEKGMPSNGWGEHSYGESIHMGKAFEWGKSKKRDAELQINGRHSWSMSDPTIVCAVSQALDLTVVLVLRINRDK